jgi:hypothetical protein
MAILRFDAISAKTPQSLRRSVGGEVMTTPTITRPTGRKSRKSIGAFLIETPPREILVARS